MSKFFSTARHEHGVSVYYGGIEHQEFVGMTETFEEAVELEGFIRRNEEKLFGSKNAKFMEMVANEVNNGK